MEPCQSVAQIIFPQDVLQQSRTGWKSSCWRWGGKERKGRILLRTPFFNPHSSNTQKTVSVKGMESCFAIFQSLHYWWIPAVTSKMKLLFHSCLENVASWDFWAIFCFGPVPFDPASMDKNSLLRQLWGWRWLDLVFFPRPPPFSVQRSLWR